MSCLGVGAMPVGAGPVGGELCPGGGGEGLPALILTRGPRARQFLRGILFANVPDRNPNLLAHPGSGRVQHVNSVQNLIERPTDIGFNEDGMYSGAIKFRFRSYKRVPVPVKIK